jgi:hypothetical protein
MKKSKAFDHANSRHESGLECQGCDKTDVCYEIRTPSRLANVVSIEHVLDCVHSFFV